jgi:hypothetical protein
MLSKILEYFLPDTHKLTLVSDPDGLLAEESLLSELTKRGFTVIQENDPIILRHRIEHAKPFRDVLVITDGSIEDLPYDLWQQAYHVHLALHSFFPNLSYLILRELTPSQIAALSQIVQPKEKLGELRTVEFLIENVFGLHIARLSEPAYLILWLSEFHQRLDSLPKHVEEYLLKQLGQISEYKDWSLKSMLLSREDFQTFVRSQWMGYLALQSENAIGEHRADYVLNFESNRQLQDALPTLLRNGTLTPVQVTNKLSLPAWVVPGIIEFEDDVRPRRITELVEFLNSRLHESIAEFRWEDWQVIALQWAELYNLQNDMGISNYDETAPSRQVIKKLDDTFTEWLRLRYSALASRKLPVPHHVHHIPHYLNYLRTQGKYEKVALLVMDGMSLSDWLVIKQVWVSRHTDWHLRESMLLAQIPTITAISRYSLISGLRPSDFYHPPAGSLSESKAWRAFWSREDLPENAVSLIALNLDRNDPTPEITNRRLQTLCLIERQIDELMHGAMLGSVGHYNNIRLWASEDNLGRNSMKLEDIIQTLLDQDFTIFISSDHGHCEADGMGKPSEGLMVQSRGRRARLYTDRRTAENMQSSYEDTFLWEDDGLLPTDLVAVLPSRRKAFAEFGEITITHGGITIDEMIVPFLEITQK